MTQARPLFAAEKSAAALLDMKPTELRELVEKGVLPPPRRIGPLERWSVAELESVANGNAARRA